MRNSILLFMMVVTINVNAQGWLGKLGAVVQGISNNVADLSSLGGKSNTSISTTRGDVSSNGSTTTNDISSKVFPTPVYYDFIPVGEDSIRYIEPLIGKQYDESDLLSYMPKGYNEDYFLQSPYWYYYDSIPVGYRYIVMNHRIINCIVSITNLKDRECCIQWFKNKYKLASTSSDMLADWYEFKDGQVEIKLGLSEINGIQTASVSYTLNF